MKQNYNDLVIHFTSYVCCKSIKEFTLHYYELIRKNEEHTGNIFFDG